MLKLLVLAFLFSAASFGKTASHGKHLVQLMGCNDCHTPRFGELSGNVPEKDHLIGTSLGFKGPWGTSYPSNLRNTAANMSESQWIKYMKEIKTKPPMPYYSLNALKADEAKAIYLYLRSLGNHTFEVPAALPPGEIPKTPYIVFEPVFPAK